MEQEELKRNAIEAEIRRQEKKLDEAKENGREGKSIQEYINRLVERLNDI